jgi:hypothetical protein
MSVAQGRLAEPANAHPGALVIFEPSESKIDIAAETDAQFVIGSAVPSPHHLALGAYSVHTSPATLQEGEQRIIEIGRRLRAEKRL